MNPANEQKPRLLVIAGPIGAGKTTVTERGVAHEWFAGCQYINPDFIARDELEFARRDTQSCPVGNPTSGRLFSQWPKHGL